MARTLLENALLLDPEAAASHSGWLLCEAGRIREAGPGAPPPVDDADRVDLHGAGLAPGFLDLHFHGELILRSGSALDDALQRTASWLLRHGTTGFLATSVTARPDALLDFAERSARFMTQLPAEGARCLGIHLEGPWVDPACAGAQPVTWTRAYDPGEARRLLAAGAGQVAMVTLAPECPGGLDAVAELRHQGVVVALGHSAAGAAVVEQAVTQGMTHVTHLFNAMGQLHHRELGTAGCALTDSRLSCDLICDGTHVHPRLVGLAARAKGERLCLISDRVDAPGPDERAAGDFGAGPLRRDGDVWRLPDDRLAGSALTLDAALARFREYSGASLLEAVAAVSLRPARVLGIEAECGSLRPGARADLVVLSETGEVRETWIAGQRAWPSAGCS